MEEIITLDGRQFKLSTDRPLTALEKQQTIAQIRQQTGCTSGCGQRVSNMGGNEMIFSMAPTCTRTTYSSTDTITMKAAPDGGIGPYRVTFYYDKGAGDVQVGATQTGITEATTATQLLTITDAIAIGAVYGTVAGAIQLKVVTDDSCPTGPRTCTELCTIGAVCVAPTCNFVVT